MATRRPLPDRFSAGDCPDSLGMGKAQAIDSPPKATPQKLPYFYGEGYCQLGNISRGDDFTMLETPDRSHRFF